MFSRRLLLLSTVQRLVYRLVLLLSSGKEIKFKKDAATLF